MEQESLMERPLIVAELNHVMILHHHQRDQRHHLFPRLSCLMAAWRSFLDSYDKVESDPECLKVQHVWGPNKEMSPRAARAFWLEQEIASLKGSITDGNPFNSSEYWSKNFHPPTGPPVATGCHRTATCGGTDDLRHHDRAGTADPRLLDQAGGCSSAHNVCRGNLLGGSGDIALQDRARTSSSGQKVCQGHLLGGVVISIFKIGLAL